MCLRVCTSSYVYVHAAIRNKFKMTVISSICVRIKVGLVIPT